MVTESTGRPRGRPRNPPRPKRPRGRPPKTFLNDPDRYVIALMDGCVLALGKTERDAALIAVAESVADIMQFDDPRYEAALAQAKACKGEVTIVWSRREPSEKEGSVIDTRIGSKWSSVESRAAVIRNRGRKWKNDPKAAEWRGHMAAAFAVALGHPLGPISFDNIRAAKHFALWEASEAGERQIAEKVILPMIDRAAGIWTEAPPDFSLIFRSNT